MAKLCIIFYIAKCFLFFLFLNFFCDFSGVFWGWGLLYFMRCFLGWLVGMEKRERRCVNTISLLLLLFIRIFCFATKVAFCSAIEINFIALAYSQIFRFAQDVFNKIFSTLGNINKFLFLSLIEKIAHARQLE